MEMLVRFVCPAEALEPLIWNLHNSIPTLCWQFDLAVESSHQWEIHCFIYLHYAIHQCLTRELHTSVSEALTDPIRRHCFCFIGFPGAVPSLLVSKLGFLEAYMYRVHELESKGMSAFNSSFCARYLYVHLRRGRNSDTVALHCGGGCSRVRHLWMLKDWS